MVYAILGVMPLKVDVNARMVVYIMGRVVIKMNYRM